MSPSFLPGAPHPQVASTDGKHLVLSQLSPSDSNYKLWHNTTADHGASDKCNMLLPVHFNQALPVKHAELFGWETGQQWQPFTSISATWSITADQRDNRGQIMKGVAKWKLLIKRFSKQFSLCGPFLKVKRETVKAANWTGLNTSADSLRVDCRNPDSPNLSNRFPQVASAGCSNADSHATGSGKQRPSVALVAIVKVHLCVLLNNPCTSKVRAKCDQCCHHKNKNKKNNRRSLHPSRHRNICWENLPIFPSFPWLSEVSLSAESWAPATLMLRPGMHTLTAWLLQNSTLSLWRQPGLRHHRGDYWWEDGVRSACPLPHLSSVQSIKKKLSLYSWWAIISWRICAHKAPYCA